MTIREVLNEKGYGLWYTTPDKLVIDATKMLGKKDVGALAVIEDDKLVGVFSERDLARKVSLMDKSPNEVTVGEIMRRNVITIDINRTVKEALRIMNDQDIRYLPVLEGEYLVGIVSIGDLCHVLLKQDKEIVDLQEKQIAAIPATA